MLDKLRTLNRRGFVRFAGAAGIAHAMRLADAQSSPAVRVPGAFPLRLGTVIWIGAGQTPEEGIKAVHDLGLPTCQIGFEQLTAGVVKPLKEALEKYSVEATEMTQ